MLGLRTGRLQDPNRDRYAGRIIQSSGRQPDGHKYQYRHIVCFRSRLQPGRGRSGSLCHGLSQHQSSDGNFPRPESLYRRRTRRYRQSSRRHIGRTDYRPARNFRHRIYFVDLSRCHLFHGPDTDPSLKTIRHHGPL